ncbi:hypothetical protein ACIQGZ_19790 [Streptomyces sp. NPDC092296]|uniref:hypothetical protein n=1 Tax=Streptomyces sp. NPDC092296 TaxID=3366012 RepID=UPI0037FF7E7A
MPVLDRRTRSAAADDSEELPAADHSDTAFRGTDPGDGDTWEIFRVRCPECDRPIALLGDEERFPQHAVLHSAWNPFASAVCPGSGQPVDEAADLADDADFDAEPDLEALLTLPPELDWRTQPFSHVGGPGSRPVRVPQMRAPQEQPRTGRR